MALLTSEHIDYITKDLSYRGIILEGFQEEVLDHLCTLVEQEMNEGKRFIEAYHDALQRFGHTKGLRHTQKQVLILENPNNNIMLRNYLKIAIRNLTKQSFYTLINVGGLAVGIASCLILALFLLNELSFDSYHVNHDRIYRLNFEIKFGNLNYNFAVSPAPAGNAIMNDYPEVETFARIRTQGALLVRKEKENFREGNIAFADSSLFRIFSLPFIFGDDRKALTEPNTIVVSRKIADKYFEGQDPVGQTLTFFNDRSYKIVGVMENMPANSHFHFDILISMLNNDESKNNSWLSNNFHTFILLKKGTDVKAFERKLMSIQERYIGPELRELGNNFVQDKTSNNSFNIYLIPLTDIHLRAKTTAEIEPAGDITYIYLFASIALFILAIACINFMNLSTARSANRAKEVGVRKVLGSMRSHLVRQFLLESILVSFVAFVLALALAYLALPTFNELADKQLQLPLSNPWFYLLIGLMALVIGGLAGIYPSLFLSAFKPIQVLKGKLALGMKSGTVRSSLVVFQFTLSIFLIVGTVAINRQLNYIQQKKIGFNKDQVIVVKEAHALGNNLQAFKTEMLKHNRIKSGTISGSLPVAGTDRNNSSYWPAGKQPDEHNMVGMQAFFVDYNYVKTLGMEVTTGRDFSPDFPADSSGVILNESAARSLHLGTDPIGKRIETFKIMPDNTIRKDQTISHTVIGIVKDFNFESLRDNITPLAMFLSNSPGLISFRFEAGNVDEVISSIQQTWKKMAPGQPFEYSFLDDDFLRMYSSEQRLGKIFGIFAGLAIIIACLGLFALSAFTAEQRTKEIGIRKVLGASVPSIVMLLSKEFGKLIIIAFVIAAPLSWFVVKWWLQNYTYKAEVGIGVYMISGLIAFLVAWITMGYQSIKAAVSNPVNSLRSE